MYCKFIFSSWQWLALFKVSCIMSPNNPVCTFLFFVHSVYLYIFENVKNTNRYCYYDVILSLSLVRRFNFCTKWYRYHRYRCFLYNIFCVCNFRKNKKCHILSLSMNYFVSYLFLSYTSLKKHSRVGKNKVYVNRISKQITFLVVRSG